MKACCNRDCNEGRSCPNRKGNDMFELSVKAYNVIGYIAAAIAVTTVVVALIV